MTTIKEIAEKAGVSIGTVDRVIHGRGSVSPKTEKLVKKVIKELNYNPNYFARQLKLAKEFNFGVLMPKLEQDSSYWQAPYSGIKKAADELNNYRISVKCFYYDKYSTDSFTNVCGDILKADLDGLLIAPVLSKDAGEFICKIPENLPYVFFDSALTGTDYLSSIVQDSFESGRLAARLMSMITKEKGSFAAVRVLPEDYHIYERIDGFKSFFNGKDKFKVKVYDAASENNRYDFLTLTKKILTENEDLKGMFISNALTFRAAKSLEKIQPDRKINIIGYDLIKENVKYLKKGTIDFLISQKPEMQGYQGIYTLFRKIVLNDTVPKNIKMPIDIIVKENVDFYI